MWQSSVALIAVFYLNIAALLYFFRLSRLRTDADF